MSDKTSRPIINTDKVVYADDRGNIDYSCRYENNSDEQKTQGGTALGAGF
jgi:hypothetical protein